MVKVTKIAVWKIDDKHFEDSQLATKEVRRIIAQEMLDETMKLHREVPMDNFQVASWIANNHDKLEAAVKAAMAGA